MEPVARVLESRGMSRGRATAVIFLALGAAATAFFVFLVPVLVQQLTSAREGFDIEVVVSVIERFERFLEIRLGSLGFGDVDLVERAREWIVEHRGLLLSYLPGALGVLSDLVIIPFVMFFLLKDGPAMLKTLISWVPNRYFEFTLNVLHKSNVQLGNYLRGQSLASLNVAILSGIALSVIGVDYYVIIAIIAGFANLIPYVGPWAGAALAVLTAVFTTGTLDDAPWILMAFAAIQMVDNLLVQPLVVSRNVELHPLAALLAVIVAGQLFGFWGLLLAVPVYATIRVVILETVSNLRRFRLA
jgi:putative permease